MHVYVKSSREVDRIILCAVGKDSLPLITCSGLVRAFAAWDNPVFGRPSQQNLTSSKRDNHIAHPERRKHAC